MFITRCMCTQPLVVLYPQPLDIAPLCLIPLSVLWIAVEHSHLSILSHTPLSLGHHSRKRAHKILSSICYHTTGNQRRPEMPDKVNEQTTNMEPIVILICHDDNLTIPQIRHSNSTGPW